MLLFFKIAVSLVVVMSLRLAWFMHETCKHMDDGGQDWGRWFAWHCKAVYQLLGLTVGAVIAVEIFKIFLPQLAHHPNVFFIHLAFAIMFFVALSLITIWIFRFRRWGKALPQMHSDLVVSCVVLCVVTNALGELMALAQH